MSYAPTIAQGYFASRCSVCRLQRGQYRRSSSREGSFFLFFSVAYVRSLHSVQASRMTGRFSAFATGYSWMLVTAPAPTVWPPSRMAKRWPVSRAMGVISSTVISTLSPGITISVFSGRPMDPVTSVVRR